MRVDPGKDSASHGEPASYTDMTPKIPATYADKIRRISTHQLAAKIETKDPRLIKQKSLEQIHRRKPMNTGSTEMLQLISFDRSSRTVSPSNLSEVSTVKKTKKPNTSNVSRGNDSWRRMTPPPHSRDLKCSYPRFTQLRHRHRVIEMQQAQGPPDDGAAAVRGAGNSNIAPTEIKVQAAQ
ncbi:hypothetical protein ACJJTC_012411 [Scirpophaga incertulas]